MNIFFKLVVFVLVSMKADAQVLKTPQGIIGNGRMPSVATDKENVVYVTFGRGDSLLYTSSCDGGASYLYPVLIKRIPGLAANYMRGPQIQATASGLVMVAANADGDIFSFTKQQGSDWKAGNKVNDMDTVAKENFVALSADGNNVFAVWLDLRENRRNKIYGAGSTDGGKTWSGNKLIYASPDSTVCECCKPSVGIKGNEVYVMFRNWLDGNRDLYIVHSTDFGNTFMQAEKLGLESWQLDGCPMDGGGMVIGKNRQPQTVWRRKDKIYTCVPGQHEKMIGDGKSCSITSVNGKNVYAWVQNGTVTVLKPDGQKVLLGKGYMPVLAPLDDHSFVCVWENDKQIMAENINL